MTAFLPTVERYSAGAPNAIATGEKYVRAVRVVQVRGGLVSMTAVYRASCGGDYYRASAFRGVRRFTAIGVILDSSSQARVSADLG